MREVGWKRDDKMILVEVYRVFFRLIVCQRVKRRARNITLRKAETDVFALDISLQEPRKNRQMA